MGYSIHIYDFEKRDVKTNYLDKFFTERLEKFPNEVQREFGYALYQAQMNKKHHKTKPLRGFDGVMEIVSDCDKDTYRGLYAYKLGEDIYVLHSFKKKSKKGIKTPKEEIEVIKQRLKIAKEIAG